MFSFKTFSTVATVAFGALSALAAPAIDVEAAPAVAVAIRSAQLPSVAQIIASATTQAAPFVQELRASRALIPSLMYSR
jgi:hypothetical protein